MRRVSNVVLGLAVIVFVLAACGRGTDGPGDDGPNVVVTTSILGDIVSQVVGDEGSVTVIMPNGTDPHDFQPSASQIATMHAADLVVVNGLGLEQGLEDTVASLVGDGVAVLEVGPGVDPQTLDGEPCVSLRGCDPHVWLDPVRMADAALLIGSTLDTLVPEHGWIANASSYSAMLMELDQELSDTFASLPDDRRKLVTNHDSLGYFASRYALDVVGTVVPGGSTLGDPSSAQLADLVKVMESENVDVIFADTAEPSRLAESVGQSLGREVSIVKLFTGSLGSPESGADTYVGLMRTNTMLIVDALS